MSIMEDHTKWTSHAIQILKLLKIKTDNKIEKSRLLLPKMDLRLLEAQNHNPDFEAISDLLFKWETDLQEISCEEYWVPQVLDFLFQCRPTAVPWFHGEDDAPYIIVGFYDTPESGSTPVSAQLHAIPSDHFLLSLIHI